MKPFLKTAGTVVTIAAVMGSGLYAYSDTLPKDSLAKFADTGEVYAPKNWREWVYVGTPLTPNALNGGEAPFPEFHNVYVEPKAFAYYQKHGAWPEGTQIAKELTMIRKSENGNFEDGSSQEVSGRGYFQGEFTGLELTVKDNKRFKDEPGGWAYFSFGHHAPPYAEKAKAFPTDSCNACHEASAADDWVFTQYYPVLRDVKKK
ncbi:cytochrome P460 family protein [Kordiimonas sp. SCSIO 12603]|uniref:cytochrome P460 family protein n=1 Tax=Kordiimonas sp. SCSIO 12603 TaxID=2829596 RepID=UPI0021025EDC|nr:cytochrome P460 family protein [Kordiimonas sp. SCSIO 12603]UTW57823.1 cytochrome P460 family protein [Kordiimonas sp. SCSIO 12603]